MGVLKTIYTKLNHYKRLDCFGELKKLKLNFLAKKLFVYGNQKEVSKKIKEMQKKYGDLGSILYVHVPDTGRKKFDDSLKLFSKCN